MDKHTCFFITPIGEAGSDIRQNADDLRDLIINPVLENYGFTVQRGDHRSEGGQIDIDVIRAVQESDLCIVDISVPNANVFYEFGRRDETGKPLILLRAKGSGELPVDVATRRYIEYDLDSRQGLKDAREQLKSFVEPIVQKGFESSGNGTSLAELAEILRRVERKVDRLTETEGKMAAAPATLLAENAGNPVDAFKLALRQGNLPLAEQTMKTLELRMDRHRWLDQVVEVVAGMGSVSAGNTMLENAVEFIDNARTFQEATGYIGYLVSNLNKTDRELENLDLVEKLCNSLKAVSENEEVSLRVEPYNQMNRLYSGIYLRTKDPAWLEKAIAELNEALGMSEELGYLHYNLAVCYKLRKKEGDLERALPRVLRAIELDGERADSDHIRLACELMYALNDERLSDYLDKLERVDAVKAGLLRSDMRK